MTRACRACSRAGTEACTDTFVCRSCYKERSVCTHLPGGFDLLTADVIAIGGECAMCAEKRTMSVAWVDYWHKKKGC